MIVVLFTGSRYAQLEYDPHKKTIWNALRWITKLAEASPTLEPEPVTLFEGEANGADKISRLCGQYLGWKIEGRPADWSNCATEHDARLPDCEPAHRQNYKKPAAMREHTYCPTAGHRRNQQMVDEVMAMEATLRLCIAAPLGDFSRGTHDCIRRAQAAHLEVRPYPLTPAPTKPRGHTNVHS